MNETVRRERVEVDGDVDTIDGDETRSRPMIASIEWSDGLQNTWNDIAAFVPKLIGFLIILLIGYVVAKAVAKAVGAVLERVGFERPSNEVG